MSVSFAPGLQSEQPGAPPGEEHEEAPERALTQQPQDARRRRLPESVAGSADVAPLVLEGNVQEQQGPVGAHGHTVTQRPSSLHPPYRGPGDTFGMKTHEQRQIPLGTGPQSHRTNATEDADRRSAMT